MPIQKPQPAAAVLLVQQAIEAARAAAGPVSEKAALDLLAQLQGYRDWDHQQSLSKLQAPQGLVSDEIKDWPSFVMFMNRDQDGKEVTFMMPPGATLQSRAMPRGSREPFDGEGSIALPSLVELGLSSAAQDEAQDASKRAASFVVKEVYAVVPDIEQNGIPHYANDLGVEEWVVQDLGWNFLAYETTDRQRRSAIDVNLKDTGDDTPGRYWMEVAVAPDVAERLEAAYARVQAQSETDAVAADLDRPGH